MSLEQFAYLAQIIGVVVVVVTLGYLAIQVRQGKELLRSQSRQALLDNDRAVLFKYLEHIDVLQKVSRPEKLSFVDQYRFAILWGCNMRNREFEWFQYRNGVLDEASWRSYQGIIRFTLGTERHRAWWNGVKSALDPGFVQMVDELIRAEPANSLMDQVMGQWEPG